MFTKQIQSCDGSNFVFKDKTNPIEKKNSVDLTDFIAV